MWRLPWASSHLRLVLAGVVGLVHLHPDPVGGVVGSAGQHLNDVLVGVLQKPSRVLRQEDQEPSTPPVVLGNGRPSKLTQSIRTQ